MSSDKATEKFNPKKKKKIEMRENITTHLNHVPMMYRAQIGRCSLQYAGNQDDQKKWVDEWMYPIPNQGEPRHQHLEHKLREPSFHCVKVEFPYRVFSNCGQDSIQRPVLDVRGIPLIPGSSVKGLFRRACQERDRIENRPINESLTNKYCGDKENLKPGCLRFHGAYPIGNWANHVVDVVHPQQERQVKGQDSTSASTLISLYNPTLIFKFSRTDRSTDWQEVESLLDEALRRGVGGKTSTGYGFASAPNYAQSGTKLYEQALHIQLEGTGVSSKLLSGQTEFRPNLFKATLRGHVSRLLAGVCQKKEAIEAIVNKLFGSTNAPSKVQIYWEAKKSTANNKPLLEEEIQGTEGTPIYKIEGTLHVNAPEEDLKFLGLVLQFAYIMGGFGKSWRRVWHKGPPQKKTQNGTQDWHPGFFSTYKTRAIGCHWEGKFIDCKELEPIPIANSNDLKKFLIDLHDQCRKYMNLRQEQVHFCDWKEAWHPNRVLVYSNVVSESKSKIVHLFHDPPFKTVTAVGGRKKVNGKEVIVTSSVWHRMLPLPNNQYLEIVTIFHGDRTPWKHRESSESQSQEKSKSSKDSKTSSPLTLKDQLKSFIAEVKKALNITTTPDPTWGKEPNL